MSLAAMLWALNQAPVEDPTAVLILIALADNAHEDGTVAYPSQRTIAYRARCSDRTVRRHLSELEAAGVILRGDQQMVEHLPARHRPVVWNLPLGLRRPEETTGQNDRSERADSRDRSSATGRARPVADDRETEIRPDAGDRDDRTLASYKPSLEPSLTTEPKDVSSAIADALPDPAPVREDVARLCEHLADRIADNGAKRPTITDGWRTSARLMIDRDGRTEEKIHAAIDWCQADEFWRANILSMPKLREKYETLRLQAQRSATRPPPGTARVSRTREVIDETQERIRKYQARAEAARNGTPTDHQPAQIGQ